MDAVLDVSKVGINISGDRHLNASNAYLHGFGPLSALVSDKWSLNCELSKGKTIFRKEHLKNGLQVCKFYL